MQVGVRKVPYTTYNIYPKISEVGVEVESKVEVEVEVGVEVESKVEVEVEVGVEVEVEVEVEVRSEWHDERMDEKGQIRMTDEASRRGVTKDDDDTKYDDDTKTMTMYDDVDFGEVRKTIRRRRRRSFTT